LEVGRLEVGRLEVGRLEVGRLEVGGWRLGDWRLRDWRLEVGGSKVATSRGWDLGETGFRELGIGNLVIFGSLPPGFEIV
jgi:hypothetical protein